MHPYRLKVLMSLLLFIIVIIIIIIKKFTIPNFLNGNIH